MHALLKRQMRHAGIDPAAGPGNREQWSKLLEMVARSYTDGDNERYTSERSFELASREMQHLLDELRNEAEERRKVEIELRHAQKLEAVGRLASGIAHEINTPIQYVGDSIYYLQESLSQLLTLIAAYEQILSPEQLEGLAAAREEADQEYLEQEAPAAAKRALDGVGRVAGIVRAMKEFAHPERQQMEPADLNEALMSTLTVARHEYKYVADVTTELGPIPRVICRLSSINQVFLNLIVNASHAIEDVVKQRPGERGLIQVKSSATEDDSALISIADSGAGIPEAIKDRIFEPFFTTKEVGRGTGQGLALARSIVVDQHGGSLTFESIAGRGTTFYVRLPLCRTEAR